MPSKFGGSIPSVSAKYKSIRLRSRKGFGSMKIFKGDDTGGMLGRKLIINVHTEYDLTGCVVIFNYQGITRKWDNVHDGDRLELFFSHNETAKMSVGTFKGVMFAVDAAGKYRTINNAIAIKVTTNLAECYGDNEFDVTVGTAVDWEGILHKPFEGVEVDLSTDDRQLAALGTIIEKLGGTVKASIALVALCAMSAFGYTTDTHTNTFVRNGVTYAQRGGMNATTYVVTNIDMTASDVGAVDKNAVRDIIRDEITPATNRLNQTLGDALDDKRNNTDLSVYGFTEWTGVPSGFYLEWDYSLCWVLKTREEGLMQGAVEGKETDLIVNFRPDSWSGGYDFTATRTSHPTEESLVTENGMKAAITAHEATGTSWEVVRGKKTETGTDTLWDISVSKSTLSELASMASGVVWSSVKETPATLSGYGITDAATKTELTAKRDLADNTCHKTEFGEWTFSGETLSGATYTVSEDEPVEGVFIYGVIENDDPYYVGEFSSRQTSLTAIFFGRTIVATRHSVCSEGKKFVTSDVVDGKVSSAVATNNPAFVSAVRNTPTENMPEDMQTDTGT